MDLSPHNFVSVNEILADVLRVVKDDSFKLSSRGWYTSQIQQALEELSFDTFFDEQHEAFDVPKNLRLDMPKGSFNLREIWAFNGTKCTPANKKNVMRKRAFINGCSGNGMLANDDWHNEGDPFYKNRSQRRETPGNPRIQRPSDILFFSIQNGVIHLSEGCRRFDKIMLVYNGIMADVGDMPIVPQFFRQAVKDWVSVKSLEIKLGDMVGTNEYNHWANMLNRYENSLNKPFDGSWAKAEHRSKQLNAKDRRDYKEYFTALNY